MSQSDYESPVLDYRPYPSDSEDITDREDTADLTNLIKRPRVGSSAVHETPPTITPNSASGVIRSSSSSRTPVHRASGVTRSSSTSRTPRTGTSTPVTPQVGERNFPANSTPLSHHQSNVRSDNEQGAWIEVQSLLKSVIKRLDSNEKEVKDLKHRILTPTSSESGSSKRKVSPFVRSETRKTYKMLVDDDENFNGFSFGEMFTWRSEPNRKAADKLVSEVKSVNPDFQACEIRDAAYTYYKSLGQEKSLSRRGKSENRKTSRRRSERMRRKLQERLSVFKKRKYSETDKKKWLKVLVPEMMSSEESGDDEKNHVKPLHWRSPLIKDFFLDLDEEFHANKSAQAKWQTKVREVSTVVSSRPVPSNMPNWAIES